MAKTKKVVSAKVEETPKKTKDTLTGRLKPYLKRYKVATKGPVGKLAASINAMPPEARALVLKYLPSGDASQMPTEQELGAVVLRFWRGEKEPEAK